MNFTNCITGVFDIHNLNSGLLSEGAFVGLCYTKNTVNWSCIYDNTYILLLTKRESHTGRILTVQIECNEVHTEKTEGWLRADILLTNLHDFRNF